MLTPLCVVSMAPPPGMRYADFPEPIGDLDALFNSGDTWDVV